MRIALVVITILSIYNAALPATIFIPDDFAGIQDAIDASTNGDTIIVRDGTWTGTGNKNLDFGGKAITLRSEKGPQNCIIDCELDGRGFYFHSGETDKSVVDGFTITNGNISDYGGAVSCEYSSPTFTNCTCSGNTAGDGGGGMRNVNSSPTVIECTFGGNSAGSEGGGMRNYYSSPTVIECTFSWNSAGSEGGGINFFWSSNPTLNNCIFYRNSSRKGGGMFNDNSHPTLNGCTFIENWAPWGGGMENYIQSSPTLNNCTFSGNSASTNGGGMSLDRLCNPTLNNCTFSGNSAGEGGGGMSLIYQCAPTLNNCTFIENWAPRGGGLMNDAVCDPTLNNCTFSGNSAGEGGGGMCIIHDSYSTLNNCILWGNSAPIGPEIYGRNATVAYSNVKGGWPGTGNIDDDPLFANTANYDFHLTWASPCRNTGNNSVVTESYDFEGDPRIHDGTVDMGSDEFHLHLYSIGDAILGSSIDVKVVGTPGTSPLTLGLGSGIQDPPQGTPYGELWLLLPVLKQIPMPDIGTDGLSVLNGTIPVSWLSGEQYPFQALAGSELTNLMVLTVE